MLLFSTQAVPSPSALSVPVEIPPEGSRVIGRPKLELTYTGTGVPVLGNQFEIFAQIVDLERNVVVNNLATPIPLELDGETHEVKWNMERIASLSTATGYELQLVANTNVYHGQRGAGEVEIERVQVSLPVTTAQSGGGNGGGGSGDGGGNGGGNDGSDGAGEVGSGSGEGSVSGSDDGSFVSTTGSSSGSDSLPFTGLGLIPLLLLGLGLAVAGTLLGFGARRHRR